MIAIATYRLRNSWLLLIPLMLLVLDTLVTFSGGNWHNCDRNGCEGCMVSMVMLCLTAAISAVTMCLREFAIALRRRKLPNTPSP